MQACARCLAAPLPVRRRAMTINQYVFRAKAVGKCLLQQLPAGEERKLLNVDNAPMTGGGGGAQSLARNLAFWSKARPSPCDAPPPDERAECPKRSCNEEPKGWFAWLFGKGGAKKARAPEPPPDPRCCRKRYCHELKHPPPDPDFSEFGGQAYKTCGIAYVIQRDRLQPKKPCETREDRLLRVMETHPDLQTRMIHDDPIRESDNLFARLVQMADLKLHPLYRKISATPLKEGPGTCKHVRPYRPLTGPLDYRHLPAQLHINRAFLERKNLYWTHKNIAPPADFQGRIMEFKPRQKPVGFDKCAEKKRDRVFDVERCCQAQRKRDTVFDSLDQKPMQFAAEGDRDKVLDREEMVYNPTC